MKKNAILVLTLCLSLFTFSMNAQVMEKEKIRKIDVTGSAEQEVLPDKIFVSITLQEYMKDNKTRVDMLVLEAQLQKAVAEAGLSKESLTVGNISGYRNWWGKKKPTTFLENKTYILTVANLAKIDGILNRIDEKGIASTNIDRYEYSKITELRKEIKIKALQAAKEKATYLLAGIGEALGEALEIHEVEEGYQQQPVYSNMMMRGAAMDSAPMQESTVDVQKIKVRYEMKASFRIK
jgi:uncharacterized protein